MPRRRRASTGSCCTIRAAQWPNSPTWPAGASGGRARRRTRWSPTVWSAGCLDDRLLSLLAAGLKDEAIARQLGVSLRTVHRRTSELSESLGARTRFQAGMRAERQGLLRNQNTIDGHHQRAL
nr:LuxR C-terminal-related transcriptional regulator [Actinocrispum wychmicini]